MNGYGPTTVTPARVSRQRVLIGSTPEAQSSPNCFSQLLPGTLENSKHFIRRPSLFQVEGSHATAMR